MKTIVEIFKNLKELEKENVYKILPKVLKIKLK